MAAGTTTTTPTTAGSTAPLVASTSPPPSTKAQRVVSFDLDAHPLPTGREEDWRFTPIRKLKSLLTGEPADGAVEVTSTLSGATLTKVGKDHPLVGSVFTPSDRASAVAFDRAAAAVLVQVAPETTDARARVTIAGQGGISYGHLVVDIGHHASAQVVLDHTGPTMRAANLEVVVGDGASLTLVSLQDWADDAVHLSAHALRLGRDAQVRHIVVSLSGALVRITTQVTYAAPGGDAELLGAFFADAGQHLEHRLFVDHEQPHCRSNVLYKGVLQGEGAHSVWVGDVLIRASAVGTDTYEVNRNLVLSDGARADSVPNLEIETGDVAGAGHASATGRFDDEQLFYLQSRGIPDDEARRLVVRGFFHDILGRIDAAGAEDLSARLVALVDARLGEPR